MKNQLEFYEYMCQNADMGAHAVNSVIKKNTDPEFERELTSQLVTYEKFLNETREKLGTENLHGREEGKLKKMMADMGMQMNTLTDSSVSKLSEIMITGAAMGIADVGRRLNDYGDSISPEARRLGEDYLKHQQKTIADMMKYL